MNSSSSEWLSAAVSSSPGDTWPCLETFLILTAGFANGILQMPGMLLTILQRPGQIPTTKTYVAPMSAVSRLRKLAKDNGGLLEVFEQGDVKTKWCRWLHIPERTLLPQKMSLDAMGDTHYVAVSVFRN